MFVRYSLLTASTVSQFSRVKMEFVFGSPYELEIPAFIFRTASQRDFIYRKQTFILPTTNINRDALTNLFNSY